MALILTLALAACAGAPESATATTPPQPDPSDAPTSVIALPTEAAVTGNPPPAATSTSVEPTSLPIHIPPPTTTPGESSSAEVAPVSVAEWAPPPYPAPWAVRPEDHFYFTRPIGSGVASVDRSWVNPRYRYGSTYFGEEPTHTGVDLLSETGDPVTAAAAGEVVWVGYGLYRGVEDETDPYGLAIAIKHDFGYEGQRLYTVYAHLSETLVWDGQIVSKGEIIGRVGNTGHTTGSHLHFEVRIGENRYFNTRNPELWVVPLQGTGVFVGRFMNGYKRPLKEQMIQLVNLDTEERWQGWTYAWDSVKPDDHYSENLVIGDLPAGPYEVRVTYFFRRFTSQFYLNPAQTNFVEFVAWEGFTIYPTPTTQPLSPPN